MSTILKQNYDNPEYLDSGGFGKVYRAQSKATGELVAIKEVDLYYLTDDLIDKLESEFNVSQSLHHPNILRYNRILKDEYFYLLEMELCDQSLENVIKSQHYLGYPLQESYIWYVISHIAAGLAHMHGKVVEGKSIIHRDIKPANVLFTDDHIKLGDLGLARETSGKSKLTTRMGTPVYMAPEVQRSGQYTTSADIWSLGCVVLEMCTLVPIPWEVDKLASPPAIKIDASYSQDLAAFVRACLQMDHHARPTAAEILEHPRVTEIKHTASFIGSQASIDTADDRDKWATDDGISGTSGGDADADITGDVEAGDTQDEEYETQMTMATALVEVTQKSSSDKTMLMEYAEKGLHDKVRGHLDEVGFQCTAPVKIITSDKEWSITVVNATALMIAAWYGHVSCVKILCEYEAKMADSSGTTALMFAAQQNHADAVVYLADLEAGMQNDQGRTAMMLAAQYNCHDTVTTLIKYEAGMALRSGSTALMIAVECRNNDIVRLLLDCEGGRQKKNGWSALMVAAQHGNIDAAKILLQREVALHTETGETALMVAATHGQEEVAYLLMPTLGGKQTRTGCTALMYAAQWNKSNIIPILASKECNMVASDGRRAIQFAAEWGYVDCVDALLQWEQKQASMTSLMIATLRNDVCAAKKLIANGYDLGCRDSVGTTALMYAAMVGSVSVASLLVDAEATLFDSTGYSALMYAVEHGHVQLVDLLMEREGRLKSKTGKSAIDVAQKAEYDSPATRDTILSRLTAARSHR